MPQDHHFDLAPMPQLSEASPSPRVGRVALLLLLASTAACSDVTGIEDIRSEMLPPASYQVLWDRVEACSGRSGDFEGLSWFWVRSFPEGSDALGQWNERHEITLALAAVANRGVVAHELLHDLLDGDPSHADPAWDTCRIPRGGS